MDDILHLVDKKNVCMLIWTSLKYVSEGSTPIENKSA